MLRGALAQEHVAGVPGHPRVLGHEAKVLGGAGVEAAEGHVLQVVEVVLGGVAGKLEVRFDFYESATVYVRRYPTLIGIFKLSLTVDQNKLIGTSLIFDCYSKSICFYNILVIHAIFKSKVIRTCFWDPERLAYIALSKTLGTTLSTFFSLQKKILFVLPS